jgi:putative ABC transport system permease protein
MRDLLWDIRYSFRMFLQHPGFVATAALSLALGIGANTTIFSAISVLMFRPLAFKEPHRLVRLEETNPKRRGLEGPEAFDVGGITASWRLFRAGGGSHNVS